MSEVENKISKAFFIQKYIFCLLIFIFGIIRKINVALVIMCLAELIASTFLIALDFKQLNAMLKNTFSRSEGTRFKNSLALTGAILGYGLGTIVRPEDIVLSLLFGCTIYFFFRRFSHL